MRLSPEGRSKASAIRTEGRGRFQARLGLWGPSSRFGVEGVPTRPAHPALQTRATSPSGLAGFSPGLTLACSALGSLRRRWVRGGTSRVPRDPRLGVVGAQSRSITGVERSDVLLSPTPDIAERTPRPVPPPSCIPETRVEPGGNLSLSLMASQPEGPKKPNRHHPQVLSISLGSNRYCER